ncbi:MAG: anticodon nuclease [Pseudomonadota bacterium]
MPDAGPFATLEELAAHLRQQIAAQNKKCTLIFAHNGTGKTRLSMAFKDQGKTRDADGTVTTRDTLYFNAYTEDLFSWDNDLAHDRDRVLRMNTASAFFDGLAELEMENRIRPLLRRHADFDFQIDYGQGTILFWRETVKDAAGEDVPVPIKISRGEENIFIWCFFLTVAQLAIDGQEAYDWVRYLYIDDPISSLDESNAIAVAAHLARMLKGQDRLKAVISSHHTLFFNVLCNELGRPWQFYLGREAAGWVLRDTGQTPRFYHVAMLKELHEAAQAGRLFTYHFTILRSIMEKTATFHGFNNLGDILKRDPDDEDGILHFRYVQLLSHGGYSLFEPTEMQPENKDIFRSILADFMTDYRFNPALFPQPAPEGATP